MHTGKYIAAGTLKVRASKLQVSAAFQPALTHDVRDLRLLALVVVGNEEDEDEHLPRVRSGPESGGGDDRYGGRNTGELLQ